MTYKDHLKNSFRENLNIFGIDVQELPNGFVIKILKLNEEVEKIIYFRGSFSSLIEVDEFVKDVAVHVDIKLKS